LRGLVGPAVSALVASGCYLTIVNVIGANMTWMCVGLAGGLLAYGLSMVLIDRRQLSEDWTVARRIISPRASHGTPTSLEPATR
jgi:hypothetical protein